MSARPTNTKGGEEKRVSFAGEEEIQPQRVVESHPTTREMKADLDRRISSLGVAQVDLSQQRRELDRRYSELDREVKRKKGARDEQLVELYRAWLAEYRKAELALAEVQRRVDALKSGLGAPNTIFPEPKKDAQPTQPAPADPENAEDGASMGKRVELSPTAIARGSWSEVKSALGGKGQDPVGGFKIENGNQEPEGSEGAPQQKDDDSYADRLLEAMGLPGVTSLEDEIAFSELGVSIGDTVVYTTKAAKGGQGKEKNCVFEGLSTDKKGRATAILRETEGAIKPSIRILLANLTPDNIRKLETTNLDPVPPRGDAGSSPEQNTEIKIGDILTYDRSANSFTIGGRQVSMALADFGEPVYTPDRGVDNDIYFAQFGYEKDEKKVAIQVEVNLPRREFRIKTFEYRLSPGKDTNSQVEKKILRSQGTGGGKDMPLATLQAELADRLDDMKGDISIKKEKAYVGHEYAVGEIYTFKEGTLTGVNSDTKYEVANIRGDSITLHSIGEESSASDIQVTKRFLDISATRWSEPVAPPSERAESDQIIEDLLNIKKDLRIGKKEPEQFTVTKSAEGTIRVVCMYDRYTTFEMTIDVQGKYSVKSDIDGIVDEDDGTLQSKDIEDTFRLNLKIFKGKVQDEWEIAARARGAVGSDLDPIVTPEQMDRVGRDEDRRLNPLYRGEDTHNDQLGRTAEDEKRQAEYENIQDEMNYSRVRDWLGREVNADEQADELTKELIDNGYVDTATVWDEDSYDQEFVDHDLRAAVKRFVEGALRIAKRKRMAERSNHRESIHETSDNNTSVIDTWLKENIFGEDAGRLLNIDGDIHIQLGKKRVRLDRFIGLLRSMKMPQSFQDKGITNEMVVERFEHFMNDPEVRLSLGLRSRTPGGEQPEIEQYNGEEATEAVDFTQEFKIGDVVLKKGDRIMYSGNDVKNPPVELVVAGEWTNGETGNKEVAFDYVDGEEAWSITQEDLDHFIDLYSPRVAQPEPTAGGTEGPDEDGREPRPREYSFDEVVQIEGDHSVKFGSQVVDLTLEYFGAPEKVDLLEDEKGKLIQITYSKDREKRLMQITFDPTDNVFHMEYRKVGGNKIEVVDELKKKFGNTPLEKMQQEIASRLNTWREDTNKVILKHITQDDKSKAPDGELKPKRLFDIEQLDDKELKKNSVVYYRLPGKEVIPLLIQRVKKEEDKDGKAGILYRTGDEDRDKLITGREWQILKSHGMVTWQVVEKESFEEVDRGKIQQIIGESVVLQPIDGGHIPHIDIVKKEHDVPPRFKVTCEFDNRCVIYLEVYVTGEVDIYVENVQQHEEEHKLYMSPGNADTAVERLNTARTYIERIYAGENVPTLEEIEQTQTAQELEKRQRLEKILQRLDSVDDNMKLNILAKELKWVDKMIKKGLPDAVDPSLQSKINTLEEIQNFAVRESLPDTTTVGQIKERISSIEKTKARVEAILTTEITDATTLDQLDVLLTEVIDKTEGNSDFSTEEHTSLDTKIFELVGVREAAIEHNLPKETSVGDIRRQMREGFEPPKPKDSGETFDEAAVKIRIYGCSDFAQLYAVLDNIGGIPGTTDTQTIFSAPDLQTKIEAYREQVTQHGFEMVFNRSHFNDVPHTAGLRAKVTELIRVEHESQRSAREQRERERTQERALDAQISQIKNLLQTKGQELAMVRLQLEREKSKGTLKKFFTGNAEGRVQRKFDAIFAEYKAYQTELVEVSQEKAKIHTDYLDTQLKSLQREIQHEFVVDRMGKKGIMRTIRETFKRWSDANLTNRAEQKYEKLEQKVQYGGKLTEKEAKKMISWEKTGKIGRTAGSVASKKMAISGGLLGVAGLSHFLVPVIGQAAYIARSGFIATGVGLASLETMDKVGRAKIVERAQIYSTAEEARKALAVRHGLIAGDSDFKLAQSQVQLLEAKARAMKFPSEQKRQEYIREEHKKLLEKLTKEFSKQVKSKKYRKNIEQSVVDATGSMDLAQKRAKVEDLNARLAQIDAYGREYGITNLFREIPGYVHLVELRDELQAEVLQKRDVVSTEDAKRYIGKITEQAFLLEQQISQETKKTKSRRLYKRLGAIGFGTIAAAIPFGARWLGDKFDLMLSPVRQATEGGGLTLVAPADIAPTADAPIERSVPKPRNILNAPEIAPRPELSPETFIKAHPELGIQEREYITRLTSQYPELLKDPKSLERLLDAGQYGKGKESLFDAFKGTVNTPLEAMREADMVKFEEILDNGGEAHAVSYLESRGFSPRALGYLGLEGKNPDFAGFVHDYKANVLDAGGKANPELVRKLGSAFQAQENIQAYAFKGQNGLGLFDEGKRVGFRSKGGNARMFGMDETAGGDKSKLIYGNAVERTYVRPTVTTGVSEPGVAPRQGIDLNEGSEGFDQPQPGAKSQEILNQMRNGQQPVVDGFKGDIIALSDTDVEGVLEGTVHGADGVESHMRFGITSDGHLKPLGTLDTGPGGTRNLYPSGPRGSAGGGGKIGEAVTAPKAGVRVEASGEKGPGGYDMKTFKTFETRVKAWADIKGLDDLKIMAQDAGVDVNKVLSDYARGVAQMYPGKSPEQLFAEATRDIDGFQDYVELKIQEQPAGSKGYESAARTIRAEEVKDSVVQKPLMDEPASPEVPGGKAIEKKTPGVRAPKVAPKISDVPKTEAKLAPQQPTEEKPFVIADADIAGLKKISYRLPDGNIRDLTIDDKYVPELSSDGKLLKMTVPTQEDMSIPQHGTVSVESIDGRPVPVFTTIKPAVGGEALRFKIEGGEVTPLVDKDIAAVEKK